MELKEFIKNVLIDLSEGVEEAQMELKEKSTVVNPRRTNNINHEDRNITTVHFEMGLMSSETENNTAGIGVFLSSVGVGVKNDAKTNNESVTRISFSLQVAFPYVLMNA